MLERKQTGGYPPIPAVHYRCCAPEAGVPPPAPLRPSDRPLLGSLIDRTRMAGMGSFMTVHFSANRHEGRRAEFQIFGVSWIGARMAMYPLRWSRIARGGLAPSRIPAPPGANARGQRGHSAHSSGRRATRVRARSGRKGSRGRRSLAPAGRLKQSRPSEPLSASSSQRRRGRCPLFWLSTCDDHHIARSVGGAGHIHATEALSLHLRCLLKIEAWH